MQINNQSSGRSSDSQAHAALPKPATRLAVVALDRELTRTRRRSRVWVARASRVLRQSGSDFARPAQTNFRVDQPIPEPGGKLALPINLTTDY